MITYGHEKFIQQSIESILYQETSFNFELVIANDCSPDATSKVVQWIIKSNDRGHLIQYFEHDQNLGMYDNFIFALNKCKGKYIAICEGDDYWTDHLKLQKQVSFLEANPDYEVCFTNIKIVNNLNQVVKETLFKPTLTDVFETNNLPNWAPTLTRVFKNRDFKDIPSAPGLDSIMLLWQSRLGKIKLLHEVAGAYRLHEGGVYSAINDANKKSHGLQTCIVALQLIPLDLMSKYFGKIFKLLVIIRYFNSGLFKDDRKEAFIAYEEYGNRLSFGLHLKIWLSFILVSLPFISYFKGLQSILLKIMNHLFIYKKSNK